MRRLVILVSGLVLSLSVVAPVAAVQQQIGGGTTFLAFLNGQNEVNAQGVPGQGDLDGSGFAIVNVNPGAGRVCWLINVRNIEPATLAHIHRGGSTVAGPVVVDLMPPLPNPTSFGCNHGLNPLLLNEIVSNPSGFYVNVHTGTFPAGAVRGQLTGRFGGGVG